MDLKTYKDEMSRIDISGIKDDNIYKILNGEFQEKESVRKGFAVCRKKLYSAAPFKVAAACGIFLLLSTVTTFAADNIIKYVNYRQTNNNAGKNHKYADEYDNNITEIYQSVADSGVLVSLDSIVPEDGALYATVTFSSENGKTLFPSTELDVVAVNGHRFENAYLTDGNNRLDFNGLMRVDDLKDDTKAVYELKYIGSDSKKLSNVIKDWDKDSLKIVLNNLKYSVTSNEDIGFVLSGMNNIMEESGINPVRISTKYDDIFITKAELADYSNEGYEGKSMDITYKYSSEDSKNAILKFKLFNTETGYSALPEAVSTIDGDNLLRTTIYRDNSDGTITISYIFTKKFDVSDLSKCIITMSKEQIFREISGCWEFDVDILVKPATIVELTEPVSATLSSMTVDFNSVEISDTSVVVKGTGQRFDEPEGNDIRKLYLMNDKGDIIATTGQMSGQTGLIDTKDTSKGIYVTFEGYFDELIDRDDVAVVVFGDTAIKIK